MLLDHPEAEDLGRFVEGTLDEAERIAIVDHIADCDDCRILVVDAAEFVEAPKVERHSTWWMGIAAALILVAAIGTLTYRQLRDLEGDVKKDYAKVLNRPLEGRLSGYPYVPRVVNRGVEEDKEIQLQIMQGEAAKLMELHGNDAKTLHAKGIGFLLGDDDKRQSVAPLQAAAERDPTNARYQSDLAAALIAAARDNRQMLESALAACDRALRIDPHSPEALFNRAVALDALQRPEAQQAYERYLTVDSTSAWADEVRKQHIEPLRLLP
ncbi:MAG: zf-HC2 domain-containing protein [Thermoanaerobaculia bacterium]